MTKKFLKVLLIVACQIFLLTGMVFADSTKGDDSYFKFKTFEEIKSEVESNIPEEYIDEIKALYNEFYQLEKDKKYFSADDKLDELNLKITDIDKITTGTTGWSTGDFEVGCISNLENTRDYRYGLPSFEEAYELELKDYADSIEEDKRELFQNELKMRYGKIEEAYEEFLTSETKECPNYQLPFSNKRNGLRYFLYGAEHGRLIFTENRVCRVRDVAFLETEDFNEFIESLSNKLDIFPDSEYKEKIKSYLISCKDIHKNLHSMIESREGINEGDIITEYDIFYLEEKSDEDFNEMYKPYIKIENPVILISWAIESFVQGDSDANTTELLKDAYEEIKGMNEED